MYLAVHCDDVLTLFCSCDRSCACDCDEQDQGCKGSFCGVFHGEALEEVQGTWREPGVSLSFHHDGGLVEGSL